MSGSCMHFRHSRIMLIVLQWFLISTVFLFLPHTVFAAIDNNITNAPADVVVGQADFTSSAANQGGSVNERTLNGAQVVCTDGTRLVVGDKLSYRYLIYNTIPTTSNAPADVVVGQPDFTSSTQHQRSMGGVISASGLGMVTGDCWVGSGKLIVTDYGNSRVLIWNSIPTQNNAPADVVIGQPDFVSATANNGGLSARSLLSPTGIASDGHKLLIVDRHNHRVLIFNSIPTSNFASADVVIGQDDFTSNSLGGNRTKMNEPSNVSFDGTKVFISDLGNGRVLIWNNIPTTNGAAADIVVGRTSFTQAVGGTVSASDFGSNYYNNVFSDGKRLFAGLYYNHRVTIWNTIPTINGAAADIVVGQSSFTSGNAGVAANLLLYPFGISADRRRLFIADSGNNRVLIYTLIHTPINFTSSAQTTDSITLSVDSFATVFGTAKYYFSRSDGVNSGWIDTPTWTDTGLSGNTGYTYTIKYGTGDGVESETASLGVQTVGPPHGGGRGSRSPGRGGIAPVIDAATKTVLPDQPSTVSPLYGPNQVPPAPAGILSPLRDRLAARIEKRIVEYPQLRTALLRMLQRLDRRLQMR